MSEYIWDGVAQPNVKGTIFGIEVQLSDSVRMEFGSEDNNTVEPRLRVLLRSPKFSPELSWAWTKVSSVESSLSGVNG
jgi:hypothetical protein